jgi:F0F1-type ATP synthase assembly protein I
MKTWKPSAAGIMTILSGAFTAWYRSAELIRIGSSPIGIGLGLIAIAGGIYAIRRKASGLALAGAICAIVPPHPWGELIWTPILGIVAVVLILASKNEFSSSRSRRPTAVHSQNNHSRPAGARDAT